MRSAKEEAPCSKNQAIDLVSAVKGLHRLSSQELNKLIRDAENNIIHCTTETGSSFQINVETLARYLTLHLIARLNSSKRDEVLFRYLLCGFRLLHTLCDLASRNPKLEQILLDDVRISTQMLDLIFYVGIVLGGFIQQSPPSSHMVLVHSSLLASSLYLLTAFVSSQWHELAQVLVAHPKGDVFMGASFTAIRVNIQFIQIELSAQHADTRIRSNIAEVNRLCQHCEASLQFLQTLCQQKLFREQLVKNKELCEGGGLLLLVQEIMKLPSCEDAYLMSAFSRLKSKVLSIFLHLCEVESFSFLDVAASTTEGLDLAKSTISEVLKLLKTMFCGNLKGLPDCSVKNYPKGLLQLNAMRLTEILTDDSNFRSHITLNFTEVLTTIFLEPHGEFLSSWCSSEPRCSEEDATLDYDSLAAAGRVLGLFSSSDVPESSFHACNVPRTSYAHQRTSLLVKIVANLSCFAPDLCKEEKDLFLNNFIRCLQKEFPKLPDGGAPGSGAERASIISRNLGSLLVHAESLIPGFLNEDDVHLLRTFIGRMEPLITQEPSINPAKDIRFENLSSWERLSRLNVSELHQEAHNRGQNSLPVHKRSSPNEGEGMSENSAMEESDHADFNENGNGVVREEERVMEAVAKTGAAKGVRENIETSGSDSSTLRLKSSVEKNILEVSVGGAPEDEKVKGSQTEEKQLRKRKRNIMNDKQIAVIEKALQDEPDMQRKAASIQYWADKLGLHGSEITSSQLKNWLNNRKAKLARAAAKDVRAPSGGDDGFTDKQGGSGSGPDPDPVSDSPESPGDQFFEPYPPQQKEVPETASKTCANETSEKVTRHEHGKYVVLVDAKGDEIGKGCIHLAKGTWFGSNLEELGLCVVDVTYLKVDKWTKLPHPCDATGTSFGQAEMILGRKRVLWESSKLLPVQQQQQRQR